MNQQPTTAQKKDLDQLLKENKIMRQLACTKGFFDYYFTECKNHSTNTAAFNDVNDLYFELFGEYRYTDYNTFKNALSNRRKRNLI